MGSFYILAALLVGALAPWLILRPWLKRMERLVDSAIKADVESGKGALELAEAAIHPVVIGAILLPIAAILSTVLLVVLADVLAPEVPLVLGLAAVAFFLSSLALAARVNSTRRTLTTTRATRESVINSIGPARVKQFEREKRLSAELAAQQFKQNLRRPFQIKYLELEHAGIFENLSWGFEPGVNVLLGRNGYGKSYLLRLLVGALANDNDRLTRLLPPAADKQRITVHALKDGEPATISRDDVAFDESPGKIPLLAIPDSRFISRASNSLSSEGDEFSDLTRFGAHHFLYDLPYDTTIQTVLAQMCIEAIQANGGRIERPDSPELRLISEVIHDLAGERFRFHKIEPVGSARFSVLLETDASPGRPIPIQQASQGTLSVVAVFGLISQYLRRIHGDDPGEPAQKKPGIVVIDEIDAHLHPAWQRKIVHLLRKHFPRVQFVLTAHSPLTVAGCGKSEVSVLYREGSLLKVREFQRDFIGATPAEIYKLIFEVDELDPVALDYWSDVPRLKELNEELHQLIKGKPDEHERIQTLQTKIDYIERAKTDEQKQIDLTALTRENEQLHRQLSALRSARDSGMSA
jgi:ABC-type multidrug transport system ATPase subunit